LPGFRPTSLVRKNHPADGGGIFLGGQIEDRVLARTTGTDERPLIRTGLEGKAEKMHSRSPRKK